MWKIKATAYKTMTFDEATVWQADKRFLPVHLQSSDNARRVKNLKRALRKAVETRLSENQREQLLLFYEKQLNKTQIAEMYGIGSSTVCKTLRSAETIVKEYVELYMQIYDLLEQEHLNEEDDRKIVRGG